MHTVHTVGSNLNILHICRASPFLRYGETETRRQGDDGKRKNKQVYTVNSSRVSYFISTDKVRLGNER